MREKLNCPLSEMNEALQKEKGLGNGKEWSSSRERGGASCQVEGGWEDGGPGGT